MKHIGYVKKTAQKEGVGKRGKWVLRSFIIEHADGSESGWISGGFDALPFAEGSYVEIDTNETERGQNYVPGSLKMLPPPSKPAPAAQSPATGSTSTPAQSKSGYVDRNDSIVYQSSRKDALALVALLLEHDALPVAASTAKSGQSKRFAEITAFVDKMTVQYVGDVQTGRLFQSVVDAGAVDSSGAGEAAPSGASAEDND